MDKNCHIDINVELVNLDYEIGLHLFTELSSTRNIYKDGDPEIETFRKQRKQYDMKNWEKNPLDKRATFKIGWRYKGENNQKLCIPDSLMRFNAANGMSKITKKQFIAMKKDIDAYRRGDEAALLESEDPVFFPIGYKNYGEFDNWDIDKYKSAKSCGYPFSPEMKKILEKHFKVYRSSMKFIKDFRTYQMGFEITIYEEAVKRMEKLFADADASRISEVDSRNKKEEEDKMGALTELKNRSFTPHKIGKHGILEYHLCPICESFYEWTRLNL